MLISNAICQRLWSFVLLFQSFKTTPRWLRILTVACVYAYFNETNTHTYTYILIYLEMPRSTENIKRTSAWGQQTSATTFLFCFTFYFAWWIQFRKTEKRKVIDMLLVLCCDVQLIFVLSVHCCIHTLYVCTYKQHVHTGNCSFCVSKHKASPK